MSTIITLKNVDWQLSYDKPEVVEWLKACLDKPERSRSCVSAEGLYYCLSDEAHNALKGAVYILRNNVQTDFWENAWEIEFEDANVAMLFKLRWAR